MKTHFSHGRVTALLAKPPAQSKSAITFCAKEAAAERGTLDQANGIAALLRRQIPFDGEEMTLEQPNVHTTNPDAVYVTIMATFTDVPRDFEVRLREAGFRAS